MRSFFRQALVCWAVILSSFYPSSLQAQFHAPETEYHDVSQRFFPVEAARVLAWLQRQQGDPVAEIKYDLKRSSGNQHQWKIRWLDAEGRERKTADVTYSDALLTNGVAFYRDIFRQLGGSSNALAGKWATKSAVENAFWEGAEKAGYSRMETIEAAFDLWKLKKGQPPDALQAAGLAGVLCQIPTFGFWQQSALDGLALARSAAWLCVAESAGATNNLLWAPILFLGDREWKARSLWSERKQPAAAAWWDVMLGNARSDGAFLFAASPEQRRRAMPMIAWHAWISDGYTIAAGHLVNPLFGNRDKDYLRLYDFAPGFADSTVENGHILDGWWPVLARAAWLRTLKAYPTNDLDFRGFADALDQAAPAAKETFVRGTDAVSENSLRKFESVAPLLRVAYNASVGPLTPVAHVSARDLLHFGWENCSLQMISRHYFVNTKWGVREQGNAIFKAASINIPLFSLVCYGPPNDATTQEALRRLQFVDWTFGNRWPAAGTKESNTLTNDASLMRRHWLRPTMMFRLYDYWLWAHPPEQWRPVVARLHEEGSRRVDLRLLYFLSHYGNSAPDLIKFGRAMVTNVPLATELRWHYFSTTRGITNTAAIPTAKECREAEEIYWSNPNSTIAPMVFQQYLLAGEFPAAKVFYKDAMEQPHDAVGYGFRMGAPRWILAMFEEDKEATRQTIAEHDTGSAADFMVRFQDAIWRKDYPAAERWVREGLERYGPGQPAAPSTLSIIQKFLPLREALADTNHADHAKALRALADTPKLPVLQWLLIQQSKLSPQEAEIFLGGEKATTERRLMIQFLRGDKSGFDATLNAMEPPGPNVYILAGWLRARLFDSKPTLEGKSLRPAGAWPIEESVLSVLKATKWP